MPIINLSTTRKLSSEDRLTLAKTLTNITVYHLSKEQTVTVVKLRDGKDYWFTGGAWSNEPNQYELTISITSGTNTPDEISSWIRACSAALSKLLGSAETSINYITVMPHEGQMWGYNGMTQTGRKQHEYF